MQNEISKISTGYQPRPHQQVIHSRMKRFNVIICHRRFGKTVLVLNELIDKALRNEKKNPQYAYIASTYSQAERVAWEYLKGYTEMIPGNTPNESKLRLTIPRPDRHDKITVWLLGSENPGALKGMYLDGAILDEFAEMDPTVWGEVIRPMLSDRLGWAIFIGTPKGKNHLYDIYTYALSKPDRWFASLYKASQTGIVAEEELEDAKGTMGEDLYNQEFECSFTAALIGSYYGKLLEECHQKNRIASVPHDPSLPVDTFWDLGIGDTTSIWFAQQVAQEYHLIDYIEMSGVSLDWYIREMNKRNYTYRDLVLPHDANARELGTGKTRVETLRPLIGNQRITVLPKATREDGIHAARMVIPMCWFDEVKCARGVDALLNYQKKWDSKNKIFQDVPLHNWASNGSDAFRYFALGVRPEAKRNISKLPTQAVINYDIFGD